MSTVSAVTIHTVEYTVEGKREVAPGNTPITILRDEAEGLAAIGALTILPESISEQLPPAVAEPKHETTKRHWPNPRKGR
jgi:hypothetical protein